MRYKTGNSLAQYGVIIGLIALALVPILFVLGSNINKSFADFSAGLSGNNDVLADGSASNTTANPASNSSKAENTQTPSKDNPQMECSGDNCTIDYGDYKLEGLPADFSTFVKSTGVSGGTDKLLSLLEQLAEDPSLDEEQRDLLTMLANKGHSIADKERDFEESVVEYNYLTDETLIDDPEDEKYQKQVHRIIWDNAVGIESEKEDFKTLLDSTLSSLSNNKDTHSIVNILGTEIYTLAESVADSGTNDAESDMLTLSETIDVTDLDSAIICGTGNGTDKDNTCK